MNATLAGHVREAADRLRLRLGPDQDAGLDAEVLARHALGWSRERWIADSQDAPSPGFVERFDALVARRAKLEPVAYITGTKEFWGLDFEVGPAVLIPRWATETLVEQALDRIDRFGFRRIADVGTGSGAIGVSLAVSRPSIEVFATDISSAALEVATRNAERHGVAGRVHFRQASVLDGVPAVELVVSNPPYIPVGDKLLVMPDVWAYEPLVALFSGDDGLHLIRALLSDVSRRDPAPLLLFEFGGSEPGVREAVAASGLHFREIVPDLAGVPRIAVVGP